MTEKFMDISNDVVFKRVMGRRANKGLLIDVLNEIIDELNIVDLEYLSPEMTGFSREGKNSRMDLRVKTDTGHEVIIEMQVCDQHDFGDRAVYYAALPILEEIESGAGRYNLTPRYIVSILHFQLDHAADPHWANEYRAKYSLREEFTREKLSDAINLIFIELGRFNKSIEALDNDKERFYFCVKHMARLREMPSEFEGNPFMENLFTTTAVESLGTNDKRLYTKFMTTERDLRNQREFALEQATNKGIAIGIEQGIEQEKARSEERLEEGISKRNLEIASAMLKENATPEFISRCTGLSVPEIKKLQ